MADAINFAELVDNSIRSSSASGSDVGASPVHSFAELVDSAIRSSSASGSDFGASPVHSFAEPGQVAAAAQLFSQTELQAATNNFSLDNRIGVVHGREVAINKYQIWRYWFRRPKFTLHQKIVIQVQMDCDGCRNKVLKIAAVTKGVKSVSLNGADRDKLVVTGYGIDIVRLVMAIRKKNRRANVVGLIETEI